MKWENVFAKHISHRGQYPEYIENFYNSTKKKAVLKWANNLNKHFLKKYKCDQQAHKNMFHIINYQEDAN